MTESCCLLCVHSSPIISSSVTAPDTKCSRSARSLQRRRRGELLSVFTEAGRLGLTIGWVACMLVVALFLFSLRSAFRRCTESIQEHALLCSSTLLFSRWWQTRPLSLSSAETAASSPFLLVGYPLVSSGYRSILDNNVDWVRRSDRTVAVYGVLAGIMCSSLFGQLGTVA